MQQHKPAFLRDLEDLQERLHKKPQESRTRSKSEKNSEYIDGEMERFMRAFGFKK